MNTNDKNIKSILENYKQICVVGLSPDSSKPSQSVPSFMNSKGYEIVGVNPGHSQIAEFPIYPDLQSVPLSQRKFVNVFRRPEFIPAIVDEIIRLGGTEVLWLQLGITHAEAEQRAAANGIQVVSNRCLLIEYRKFIG